jgi:hypothetical protein
LAVAVQTIVKSKMFYRIHNGYHLKNLKILWIFNSTGLKLTPMHQKRRLNLLYSLDLVLGNKLLLVCLTNCNPQVTCYRVFKTKKNQKLWTRKAPYLKFRKTIWIWLRISDNNTETLRKMRSKLRRILLPTKDWNSILTIKVTIHSKILGVRFMSSNLKSLIQTRSLRSSPRRKSIKRRVK